MKRSLAIVLLAGWAVGAFAQGHVTKDGFVVLRTASSTNIFYDCDLETGNSDFTNLVTYLYEGENLFLGSEVKSTRVGFNCPPGIPTTLAADVATLFYRIDSGATNALNLPHLSTAADDLWQEASATGMVEIGRELAVGLHTVDVYFVTVDQGHCLAPGFSSRLPVSGAFSAVVEVRAGAADVRACDEAGDVAYHGGWTNGANGGHGFGPWTQLVVSVGDGDAAGFFASTNPPNADLNFIASRGRAWATYANEGGGEGDDLQIAAAFRSLDTPLAAGETFAVEIEHGGIQAGSLSENAPPRTGGWVGFALRSSMPEQFGDPDPFSAFGQIQNAQVAVGFCGGDATYRVYDVISPSGRDTGLPYTSDGVRAELTMTGADTFELTLTSKGPGAAGVKVAGQTGGGTLGVVGLYNRNAEESDAHFNRLLVSGPAVTNRLARDDAADLVYTNGWAHESNGGIGFDPWLLSAIAGDGSAGYFLATNPPNTDLNGIASKGRAWGLYAKDDGGGGVQSVTAYRYFTQGAMTAGQTFGVSLEHGGIASINGSVEITLLGTQTFPNPQGEVLTFNFKGGTAAYQISDYDSLFPTEIPFTVDGIRFDFQLLDSGSPARYVLTLDARGANGGVYRYCGRVESAPKALRFRITDVEDADVFLNRLYLAPAGGVDDSDSDGDGMPTNWEEANGTDPDVDDAYDDDDDDGHFNLWEFIAGTHPQSSNSVFRGADTFAGMVVPSVTGRLYTLESTTNLLLDAWQTVAGQVDIPGTGAPLALTNAPEDAASFRTRVRMGP